MPITYLDEEPKKITYLDERESKPFEPTESISALKPGMLKKKSTLAQILGASPEERIAQAQNAYAISQKTGIPLREVVNRDLTQKEEFTGIQREPRLAELLQSQAYMYGMPALAASVLTNPVPTIAGAGTGLIGQKIGEAIKPFKRMTSPESSKEAKELSEAGDLLFSSLLAAGTGYLGYKGGQKINEQAIAAIKKIPNKFFRGGLTKPEALKVETDYGSSNGSLVETVKNKLNQKIADADQAYNQVFQKAPEDKFINIKSSINEAGRRLKRLGLITERGNLTELGKSEIARDSVYGKLLDFYQSADAISGVKHLQGKDLTQSQMIKSFSAMRETRVNKEQYLFLRDKLNALYRNKPSDIDVGRVVDSFYQSGENSGLKGLQAARALERKAFYQSERFLNRNTGDLKIATEQRLNRISTDKPLSLQEMKHIKELQEYIDHPIISDAGKINKLNKAKELLLKRRQLIKGAAVGAGLTYLGMRGARRFME